MKKLKLYSGIGLLLAFFFSIMYICVADQYGLWTEKTLYVSLLYFIVFSVCILFGGFCAWLTSDGVNDYE